MAIETGISWTDSTFNPWIGCTNISAGCDHCYAEAMNSRRAWVEWGPHGTRRMTADSTWKHPEKWQREAKAFQEKHGHRQRVFCASLADVFDNRAPAGARDRLWALIRATPDLDWQLLTKRPENIDRFLPDDWGAGYLNVWLGITAEDQAAYDRRWPILARTPAAVRFVSYEPAIGPLRLGTEATHHLIEPDWLIFGGESGQGARTCDPVWEEIVRDDCDSFGVAYFRKQWGTYKSNPLVAVQGRSPREALLIDPPANGHGGALYHGRIERAFPASAAPMLAKPELAL